MNPISSNRLTSYCYRSILCFLFLSFAAVAQAQAADPLPSWNSGPAKSAIVQFVKDVTKKADPISSRPQTYRYLR